MALRQLWYYPVYYGTLLLFGAGGFGLCVLSLLAGGLPPTDRTQRFFQRLIHRHLVFFHWWCDRAGLVHVRYDGFGTWPAGGRVLAANHVSLIDVTCLLARLPAALCIFKPAIRRNPVLGAAARRAGYLGNDGGHDLVRLAADKVAAGQTLVIFPEGTRAPPDGPPLPCKAGAVLIARRARVPLQLVRITTDSDLLTKGRAWWRLPRFPARVTITAGPLVPLDAPASTARLTAGIEAWFRTATPAPEFSPRP
ncbi:MAG TPA: lysophospholipid acyltransferase family protein [Lacunisphaera sp.]|jgi:1-acyl-sn-glycerol-3-phosphate acyltransferase|nr:lysophospholipid acyltransferase family protein [Lacunisphaera sp.]